MKERRARRGGQNGASGARRGGPAPPTATSRSTTCTDVGGSACTRREPGAARATKTARTSRAGRNRRKEEGARDERGRPRRAGPHRPGAPPRTSGQDPAHPPRQRAASAWRQSGGRPDRMPTAAPRRRRGGGSAPGRGAVRVRSARSSHTSSAALTEAGGGHPVEGLDPREPAHRVGQREPGRDHGGPRGQARGRERRSARSRPSPLHSAGAAAPGVPPRRGPDGPGDDDLRASGSPRRTAAAPPQPPWDPEVSHGANTADSRRRPR